jgi:hypothetical protein
MKPKVNVFPFLALLSAVPFFAFQARGQETSCTRRSVSVSVVNEQGLPVRGLAAGSFQGEFRGKPVKIEGATMDAQPRRVAVLLDGSASMREGESGKWKLAQEIAGHALQSGLPNAKFSFHVFGVGGRAGSPHTGEPIMKPERFEDLMTGLATVDFGPGRGPIFDILLKGMELLEKPKPGDVIFLVTDGGEESSKAKPEDVERELVQTGVRVFAVSLPTRIARSGLTVNEPAFRDMPESSNFLSTVALSGGRYYRVRPKFWPNDWGFHFDENERIALATALQTLYFQIALFYRLEITLALPVERAMGWRLEVLPPPGVEKKSLRLFYQSRLLPCAAP